MIYSPLEIDRRLYPFFLSIMHIHIFGSLRDDYNHILTLFIFHINGTYFFWDVWLSQQYRILLPK